MGVQASNCAGALLRRAEVKVEACMPGSLRSKGGGASVLASRRDQMGRFTVSTSVRARRNSSWARRSDARCQ